MMRQLAPIVALLAGCASYAPKYNTRPSMKFYPLEAKFSLLGTATATACAPEDQSSNKSHHESAIGPGHIFELAKTKAAGNADGLIVTSVEVNYVNGQWCTTVRGRPFTIDRIEAVPPGGKQVIEVPVADIDKSIATPNFGNQ